MSTARQNVILGHGRNPTSRTILKGQELPENIAERAAAEIVAPDPAPAPAKTSAGTPILTNVKPTPAAETPAPSSDGAPPKTPPTKAPRPPKKQPGLKEVTLPESREQLEALPATELRALGAAFGIEFADDEPLESMKTRLRKELGLG